MSFPWYFSLNLMICVRLLCQLCPLLSVNISFSPPGTIPLIWESSPLTLPCVHSLHRTLVWSACLFSLIFLVTMVLIQLVKKRVSKMENSNNFSMLSNVKDYIIGPYIDLTTWKLKNRNKLKTLNKLKVAPISQGLIRIETINSAN